MPTVPLYNQPKVEQAAMPGVRSNLDVSAETFGGGQSLQNVGNATNSLIKEINTVAANEMQKANEAWLVGAKSRALALKDSLQYGENGFTNKKLGQVHGISEVVSKDWDTGLKDIYKSANNDDQRLALDKFSVELSHDLNRDLQKHVYSESLAYDNKSVESYLNLRQGSVANYVNQDGSVDLDKVKSATEDQTAEILKYANRNGLPPESVQEFTQDALNKSHATVINKILSTGNGEKAKAYYDLHSSEISGDYKRKLEEAMASEIALDRGVQLFSEAKQKYLRPDGTIDEGKVEAMVLARKDWSSEEKTKALSIFNSRASEFYQNLRREDSAQDRDIMNNLIKIRQSKEGSLEQAIRYANSTGRDLVQKRQNVAIAQKLFQQEEVDNPLAYMDLWEGVQNGSVSRKQIDDAFLDPKNPLINRSQYIELRKDLDRSANGEISSAEKNMTEYLVARSKSDFSGNPEARAKFMYSFNSLVQGKSPEESLKIYEEQIKTVGSKWYVPFSGSPQWKADYERKNKNDLYWGEVKSSVGDEQTRLIMHGIQAVGKKNDTSPSDIDAFAANFGGLDKIKRGTPVNNAIQSMKNMKGKNGLPIPISADNIKAFLAIHPDGKL